LGKMARKRDVGKRKKQRSNILASTSKSRENARQKKEKETGGTKRFELLQNQCGMQTIGKMIGTRWPTIAETLQKQTTNTGTKRGSREGKKNNALLSGNWDADRRRRRTQGKTEDGLKEDELCGGRRKPSLERV